MFLTKLCVSSRGSWRGTEGDVRGTEENLGDKKRKRGGYLRRVEDTFDLHQIGDVPRVLGEGAQRESVVSHTH